MAFSDNIDNTINRYIRAFNERDYDTLMSLYAAGATLEDPVGSPLRSGRDNIRAFYESFRDQPSYLQRVGDLRIAESAAAFSFCACIGVGATLQIIEITDTFLFDNRGQIKEMRAFWGAPNIHGIDIAPGESRRDSGLNLAGHVALITGTQSAIGNACALELARLGARIVVAAEPGASGNDTLARIKAALAQGAMVTATGIDSQLDAALEPYGRVDIVVNVLAQTGGDAQAALQRQLDALQAGERGGTIVNIAADILPFSIPSESRAAIRVNHIVIGAAWADLVRGTTDPESISANNGCQLLIGSAASAVQWLASARAAAVNRQVITLS